MERQRDLIGWVLFLGLLLGGITVAVTLSPILGVLMMLFSFSAPMLV